MDNLEYLREAIARVFQSWEAFPGAVSKFRIVGACDVTSDRYMLQHVNFDGERYASHLLAHLEIREGKIWILTDNTEEGIATELAAAGVPTECIVLGYFPPAVRALGEFAVA